MPRARRVGVAPEANLEGPPPPKAPAFRKPANVEEEHLFKMFAEYPRTRDWQTPSSWVVFSDDWTVRELNIRGPCHAGMSFHKTGLYDQLITAVTYEEPYNIAYQQWLINGPFRFFKDRIRLETCEYKGETKYFIRCTKLDTWPANVLYNFCIATRVPIEHHEMTRKWDTMVKAGVNPSLAFVLAAQLRLDDVKPDVWDWELGGIGTVGAHFWFDTRSDIECIIKGQPEVKKFSEGSFKNAPKGCRPCNVIWGEVGRNDAAKYVDKTVRELSVMFGLEAPAPFMPVVEPFVADPGPLMDEDDEFDLDDDEVDFDEDNEVFDAAELDAPLND